MMRWLDTPIILSQYDWMPRDRSRKKTLLRWNAHIYSCIVPALLMGILAYLQDFWLAMVVTTNCFLPGLIPCDRKHGPFLASKPYIYTPENSQVLFLQGTISIGNTSSNHWFSGDELLVFGCVTGIEAQLCGAPTFSVYFKCWISDPQGFWLLWFLVSGRLLGKKCITPKTKARTIYNWYLYFKRYFSYLPTWVYKQPIPTYRTSHLK